MAPKRNNAREITASTTQTTTASTPTPLIPSKASLKASSHQSPQEVAFGIWQNYLDTTPQRTKLIDAFMVFLMVVGALQFVYCLLVGNYVCLLGLSDVAKQTNANVGNYSHSMPSFLASRQRWDNSF
jgi:hypothetical protein